ncbi:MAG: InlB B-repeat-containing protein [Candidatus Bathyarchaeota archaeon]|nr:InlB B-repeat-containing protein [Candidatus Termiticorpusculum sp.]
MEINIKYEFKQQTIHKKNIHKSALNKRLLFTSLLFILLISSISSCIPLTKATAEFNTSIVNYVSDESELRTAVNSAQIGTPLVIALTNNITITESSLVIPSNIDVTLTNADGKVYTLICDVNTDAITVYGILKLDGLIVNHTDNTIGRGIYNFFGTFEMYDGEISGNKASLGGGVYNIFGTFIMYGGKISDNIADNAGGVFNYGDFEMYDGEISGNKASSGGGVYNLGTFTMHGGKISENKATHFGGGISNFSFETGIFEMYGGVISGNEAENGGGIYIEKAFTNLIGGEISYNSATRNGGGICVNVADLPNTQVYETVSFSNNEASKNINYNTKYDEQIFDKYYNDTISCVTWSSPYTVGYNNFDIGYTCNVMVRGGSIAVEFGVGLYTPGEEVSISVVAVDGSVVYDWDFGEGVTVVEVGRDQDSNSVAFIMPAQEITVIAVWSDVVVSPLYVVTFDYNDEVTNVDEVVVNAGDTVERPVDPSRTGYRFDGWFLDGKVFDFYTAIDGDITLYAQWTRVVHVNGLDILIEDVNGVSVLKPSQDQMNAILNAGDAYFDMSGSTSVELQVYGNWFKDAGKTITIKTDDGVFSVTTKQLWNNSGKQMLVTVNNGKLQFKNV